MDELFSLSDKVAIVTGAARGNGQAIAEGFLRAGAIVYFVDILPQVKENPNFIISDISTKDGIQKIKDVIDKQGRLDILVNNAGISISEPSEIYSEENWDRTWQVNLKAPFMLSQMACDFMMQQNSGSIINITSLGAELGFPNNPAYIACKGGLKQLTKALARDWAKYNIRVNNLGPGYMKTDMTRKSWSDPKLSKERELKTMLSRWGKPSDLIGPAIFLASSASAYITGQDIYVDGGWLAKGL